MAASVSRVGVWQAAVWAGTFVWAVALFAIVRDRYEDFRFARYDLGNMVQAVWSTAHGRPFETTLGPTGEQIVRLGSHVDPILALLAPLWLVAPSPLTLCAVQVAAVAVGAVPVFWLARRHTGSERVAGHSRVRVSRLSVDGVGCDGCLPPGLPAIPLFLFAVWFLEEDRLVPFAMCALLAAMTGELMGLVVAALGVWYALARRPLAVGKCHCDRGSDVDGALRCG